MSKNSLGEISNKVSLMISGLKINQEQLKRRAIDATFTASLENALKETLQTDNEQESLKAQLKSKTAEYDKKLAALHSIYTEAKSIVKLDIPKEKWKEFGIDDKK